MRNEGPPNSVVVAEDLAHALAKLSWDPRQRDDTTMTEGDGGLERGGEGGRIVLAAGGRPRSASSVVLFEPEDDNKEDIPAISVDDYTDSGDERSPTVPTIISEKASIHTARPPTELMQQA